MIPSAAALRDELTDAVADRTAETEQMVAFGPHTVSVRFYGTNGGPAFLEALGSGRIGTTPRFTIHVLDAAGCGLERPRLAWTKADFSLKRKVTGWSDSEITLLYLRCQAGVALIDWTASQAIVWVPSMDAMPYYEYAAPFRWLFDLFAEQLGLVMLHAACVGPPDTGLLIVGAGGSGKSTLALSALAAGLRYVGDDYCLLDPGGNIRAHAIYVTGKWSPEGTVQPNLAPAVTAVPRPSQEHKAVTFLNRGLQDRLIASLQAKAILLPEFTGAHRPAFVPCAPHDAFRALAPTTLAQSEAEPAPLAAAIADLSRRLPSYRLRMPPDAAVAAATLNAFAQRLEQGAEDVE